MSDPKARVHPAGASRAPFLAALLGGLSLTAQPAQAQSYDRIAPKELPAKPPADQAPAPPVPPAPAANSDKVILPALKGLAFVPDPAAVRPQGSAVTGVDTGGIDLLSRPAFRPIAESYLGKPLRLADLNDLARRIVAFYRENDHPLVDVLVPEQDIDNGTVQVVVREFTVGKVVAQGNEWFDSDLLTRHVSASPGDRVRGSQLLNEVNSLNENPFRQVDLVYRPGVAPGTTDLVLSTRDRFPVRIYAGYDNSGAPSTGRDRWNLGFNWGNAFWQDHQLSYQLTTSDDFWHDRPGDRGASFIGHAVSWLAPLPWQDRLMIFGSYEESVPRVGGDFGLVGKSGQASLRYQMPLARTSSFAHQLEFGYDFKTTNNNLAFGGVQISRTATEISQFSAKYDATLADRWGSMGWGATLVWSPGGLTGDNTDAAFQPGDSQSGRLGAKANYLYVRSELNGLVKLPADAAWATRVVGQLSNRPLLDTEQLGAGGADILRGYDERAVNGDQGVLISTELRSPAFKLVESGPGDALQLLAFLDYGSLWNRNIPAGESENVNLASTGVGLGYTYGTYLTVKVAYGWQLRKLPGAAEKGELSHVSVTLSY
ncbi:ShlB/FhaC/HecB family hemolysin secretion/activation protein [Nitrospirillum iridis]|uniref:Hemolysin activation/secretion protein n=1 Tax=Nitrospirillum iridis TaxID=765888 RepID=A0A7X0EF98_9PROT|nr:ShlB/FhaC/HecB family hemolysin secretion/activation protein [Nitrospirillum iridis]MBB6252841.1 hemolysin activation/secretion protein [Nitrospirillum iridis]